MPPKENKTADKKAYQSQYRKDHPKSKEEQKEYMKKYIATAVSIDCPICKAAGYSGSYKSYNKYKHDASIKHQEAEKILKAKHELKKREEEEAAAQAKALAESEAKRNKPVPAPRKKKTEEKPTPAPRKKKEEEPKEKAEALKALEEYGSSSEEEKEKEKIEDIKFKLQSVKINSEAVTKYIEEHHINSANPARSAETKTPRLNKNLSLWRKVSKELDGKTFKDLGMKFGKIVVDAYDKPNSQADFAQMLKQVILHFTKVPKSVEEEMKQMIRDLKDSGKSKAK